MADDVAALGFSVDSSELKAGSDQMRIFESVAKRTGETAEQVQIRFERLAEARRKDIEATTKQTEAEARLAAQMNNMVAANDNVRGAMGRSTVAATGLSGAYAKAEASANSLLRTQLALVAGFLGPIAVIHAFFSETIEAEKVQAQLSAQLEATGKQAGQSIESLNEYAQAMQKVTIFSDEQIGSAQNVLLKFPFIRENFQRATTAALDLASTTGKDLNSAMQSIGRALNDPAKGLQALRREGIQLTESNKELIEKALSVGDALKAQDIILKELEGRFKGAAAAAAGTLGGALTQLKNAFGDLFEQTNSQASKDLTKSIQDLARTISSADFKNAFAGIGAAIFNEITAFIKEAIAQIALLSAAISAIKLGEFAVGARAALGIFNVEQGGDFEKQAKALETTIDGMNRLNTGTKLVVGTNKAWQDFASKAGDTQKKAAISATQALQANVSALGSAATNAEKYEAGLARLAEQFQQGEITADTFRRVTQNLDPAFRAVRDAAGEFINDFVQGMIEGKDATEILGNALKNLGEDLTRIASKDLAANLGKSISGLIGEVGGAFGGPLGTLAVGAGISLIGKLFGGSNKEAEEAAKKQAEELKKAQEAWAGMTQQVADFNREAAGLVKGDLTKAIQDITKTGQELQAAATKAKDFAAASELAATTIAIQTHLLNEFTDSLPRLHQELSSEGGLSGALAQSVEKVGQFRDQMMGLKDSLIEASRLTTSDFFTGAMWSQFAAEAQVAALAMLDLEKPLSEIETQIATLNGTALGLQSALVDLGMSAEDAAVAISQKLNKALDELRTNFLEDLIAKVNELAGGGFINQGEELVKQVAQLRADAAALGVQTALIDEFYIRSAQKIIDENELVGFQFEALVNMLGLAGIGLHEFNQALEDTAAVVKRTTDEINSTIMSYQDQLFVLQQNQDTLGSQLAVFDLQAQRQREDEIKKGGEAIAALEALLGAQRAKIIADWNAEQLKLQEQAAKDALEAQIKAIEAQKKAINDQIRAVEDAIKDQQRIIDNAKKIWEAAVKVIEDARRTIQNFVSGFLGGTQSFLSPEQQMQTAIATFNQQLTLARQGDQAALQGITGQANNALTAIKNYFGSTATGAELQQQILNQLTGLPSQLDPNMLIVDAVDRQTLAQAEQAAAQIVKLQSQLTTLQSQLAALNSVDTSVDAVNAGVTGVVTQVTGVNTDTNSLTPIQTNTQQAATSLLALAQISSNTATTANQVLVTVSHLATIATNTTAIRGALNYQSQWWGVQALTPLPSFARGGLIGGAGGPVPIMAHAGEMIMTRVTSQQYRGVLESMNSGRGSFSTDRIEDALQRLIGVVVMASETDHELLGSLASDFKTMAKAERRVR